MGPFRYAGRAGPIWASLLNGLFVQNFPPDKVKGGIFPLVPELEEDGFQQRLRVGMEEELTLFAPLEKLIGVAVVIIVPLVDLAGGKAVTEHFRHVFLRHFHAADAAAILLIVGPVFEMMAIPALMVEPGGAVAEELALLVVGTVVSLKVLCARPELHGRKLGEVMGQALPVQAQAEAVFPHEGPVAAYGFQMFEEVQNTSPQSRIVSSQYSIMR